MSENEIWTPPLSSKDHKRLNRQRGRRWQKVAKWTGFPDKTLWDWLQLLAALAIPVVVAAGTLWFSAQQSESSAQASDKQHQTDLQIAKDQQEESALQTYLDWMSDLLLNHNLHESKEGDEVRNVARSRTITVLPQLNGERKGELVRFLYEAGLIDQKNIIISLDGANLSGAELTGADLSYANLSGADLFEANLSDAKLVGADLSYAKLVGADLFGADLNHADLSGADLSDANLTGADLNHADLSGANLSDANLFGADLNHADFPGADLSDAKLVGADLNHTDFTVAHVTDKQLKEAKSLQGATMPDGSKHP